MSIFDLFRREKKIDHGERFMGIFVRMRDGECAGKIRPAIVDWTRGQVMIFGLGCDEQEIRDTRIRDLNLDVLMKSASPESIGMWTDCKHAEPIGLTKNGPGKHSIMVGA